jgi:hypothetical protein
MIPTDMELFQNYFRIISELFQNYFRIISTWNLPADYDSDMECFNS